MSQILDALRRAEAQRSRGRVPGLHEPVAQVTLQPSQSPTRAGRRPLVITAVLLLVIAAIGLLIVRWRNDSGPPVPTRVPAEERAGAAPPALISEQKAAVENPPQPAIQALPDPQLAVGLPRKAQLPDVRSELRESPARPSTGLPSKQPLPEPAKPAHAESVTRGVGVVAGASRPAIPTTVEIPARHDLPPEIQRSLPPVTVSGSVYSSDPAQRMLVVNGEVWHEGDQIRPGLILEQIRRRDAVLRYNGFRFTVGP
ncbi:MAG: general secretion pathway protein GspB [Ideonella sp.]